MLEPGSQAPEFDLEDQTGARHRLSDYRGKWVVLYFYPKDDTPGCTKEACGFRDARSELSELNAVVLGVSADDRDSHQRFATKFGLGFPLLADPERSMLRAYQAIGEKRNFGRVYEGILRVTYLIGPDGVIVRTWPKVKAEEHADEVRRALEEAA